jgi:hypothetical protein
MIWLPMSVVAVILTGFCVHFLIQYHEKSIPEYENDDLTVSGNLPKREAFSSNFPLTLQRTESRGLRYNLDWLRKERKYATQRRKSHVIPPFGCGKCGVFFAGWKYTWIGFVDGSGAFGFSSHGSSNYIKPGTEDKFCVDDITGPVGFCWHCWQLFCGKCAHGEGFFAKDSYASALPRYTCPICRARLSISDDDLGPLGRKIEEDRQRFARIKSQLQELQRQLDAGEITRESFSREAGRIVSGSLL